MKTTCLPLRQGVSIQLIAPASGAVIEVAGNKLSVIQVSIQLIAPASGAFTPATWNPSSRSVSIQLIAPASGGPPNEPCMNGVIPTRFHSTDCPSEWGLLTITEMCTTLSTRFHSTDCPSEWGLGFVWAKPERAKPEERFHSTDCPSEWGPWFRAAFGSTRFICFHSTDCPSEWGPPDDHRLSKAILFPFN